ncbi:CoA pyrophosphatase [Vibrio sp. T187]|uniref:CoA pyrophosphatase n=1 Tax=Vibrio TaxID=662 RepID=UPI0010C9A9A0|nr:MULTISPECIES: CoA pyrophosphatase [Vibrio]MBW3694835.1 CoA pyrophosphatase [Vibrio sp. T187]
MNKLDFLQNFQLKNTIAYHPESMQRVAHLDNARLRKAAVLIGLVERDNGLQIIFTKRAEHLKHHPGQVSFPGGKFEPSDQSLQITALRELEEEVGIEPNQVKIVGQLPEIHTISHFSVTPVVAMVDPNYQVTIDFNEVESVFEVPAEHVLDRNKLFSYMFPLKKFRHRVFAIPFNEHLIWGMTAQIIQSLQQQLMKPST